MTTTSPSVQNHAYVTRNFQIKLKTEFFNRIGRLLPMVAQHRLSEVNKNRQKYSDVSDPPKADICQRTSVQEVPAEPFPGTVAQGVVLLISKDFRRL